MSQTCYLQLVKRLVRSNPVSNVILCSVFLMNFWVVVFLVAQLMYSILWGIHMASRSW